MRDDRAGARRAYSAGDPLLQAAQAGDVAYSRSRHEALAAGEITDRARRQRTNGGDRQGQVHSASSRARIARIASATVLCPLDDNTECRAYSFHASSSVSVGNCS
jgi:hypothetical protein